MKVIWHDDWSERAAKICSCVLRVWSAINHVYRWALEWDNMWISWVSCTLCNNNAIPREHWMMSRWSNPHQNKFIYVIFFFLPFHISNRPKVSRVILTTGSPKRSQHCHCLWPPLIYPFYSVKRRLNRRASSLHIFSRFVILRFHI